MISYLKLSIEKFDLNSWIFDATGQSISTFYSMIIIGWLGCWATRDEVVTQKPHKRKKDNFHSSPNTIPIIRKKNGSFVFRDTKRLISQYFVPKPKKNKEKTLQKRWPNKLLVKHCRVNGVSTANFIPSFLK